MHASARLKVWTARVLAGLGGVFLIATLTPVTRWWAAALSREWYPPQGDVLIVLAADAADARTIGQESYWRAVYALWAWRRGSFRRVIVSGGGQPPPAVPLRLFLIAHGVPADSITLETESASTWENAVYTSRLLSGTRSRLALLTSDYHSFRATRVFRRAGLAVLPCPAPDALKGAGPWRSRWPVFLQLCEETLKIAAYGIQGKL
jgi:uncharacterized SAM-binding protein YcdF (DUF218 family)